MQYIRVYNRFGYTTGYITYKKLYNRLYAPWVPRPLVHGWDVIYNSFVSHIIYYITKVWLYIGFFYAYIIGSDPLLGSIIPFFFGYLGNKWLLK